jgi:hypothetical protein
MTNTELKEIAKKRLQEAIGCAYYQITDSEEYSEEDTEKICEYIRKYGTAACKAFGEKYVSY